MTRRILGIAAAAALLGAFSADAFASITISLKESARIEGSFIKLRDVAVIKAPSQAESEKVAAIFLGKAPAPGIEKRITRTYLKERLHQCGVVTDEVVFGGAMFTRVLSGQTVNGGGKGPEETEGAGGRLPVTTDVVRTFLEDYISRKLKLEKGDFTVRVTSARFKSSIPAGSKAGFVVEEEKEVGAGRNTSLRLGLYVNGKRVEGGRVNFSFPENTR